MNHIDVMLYGRKSIQIKYIGQNQTDTKCVNTDWVIGNPGRVYFFEKQIRTFLFLYVK